MTDFRHAWNTVIAELTPQSWDYTDGTGTTLTVIPAGLREAPGYAEVMVRVTVDPTQAAEIGITTTYMVSLLHAIETQAEWEHATNLDDSLTITPVADGGVVLTVVEAHYEPRRDSTAAIHVPADQRLPLASALRRATDVARGWED